MARGIKKNDFKTLFESMNRKLVDLSVSRADRTGYEEEIRIVGETISILKSKAPVGFASDKEERVFFAKVWPRFYGKLFYFQLLHQALFEQSIILEESWPKFLDRQEQRATAYFRRHRKFWRSYLSENDTPMVEFTRSHSQTTFFSPLFLVVDSLGATVASWHAAWGLAFQEYRTFIKLLRNVGGAGARSRLVWKETQSAAAEMIKAQAEAKSFYIEGRPATAAEIRADFEERYGVDLKDFDNLIYAMETRKSDETAYYLVKLQNALKARRDRLRK
jgi:hypothetical protein